MHKTQCISKMMSLFRCLAKIGILTNILGEGTTATARQPSPSEQRQWKWHDSQRGNLYNSLCNPCNILYIILRPISLKNGPFLLLKLAYLFIPLLPSGDLNLCQLQKQDPLKNQQPTAPSQRITRDQNFWHKLRWHYLSVVCQQTTQKLCHWLHCWVCHL